MAKGDILVTYHRDGTITREPFGAPSASMDAAAVALRDRRRPKRPPDYGMGTGSWFYNHPWEAR